MFASQLALALVALFIYSGADAYGNDRSRMLALAACLAAPLMCSFISEIFLPAFFFVTADANLKSTKGLVHHIYTLYNAPPPFWPSAGESSAVILILWLIWPWSKDKSQFTDHSGVITPKHLPTDHKSKQMLLKTPPPDQKPKVTYPTLPKPPKARPSEPVLKKSKTRETKPRPTYIQRLKDQIGDVPPYPRRFCTRWEEEHFLERHLKSLRSQKKGDDASVVEKDTSIPVRAPENRYRSPDPPVQPQDAVKKPEQAENTHLVENNGNEGDEITTAAIAPDTFSEMKKAIPDPPSQLQDVGELPARAESIHLAHQKGGDATADGATTSTTQVRAPQIEYRSLDLLVESEDVAKQPEQVAIPDLTENNGNEGSEVVATTSIPDTLVGDTYIQPVEPEYTQLGPLFTTWREVAILQHAGSNEAAAENTITTIADRCSEMENSGPSDEVEDLVAMMGELSLGTVLKGSEAGGVAAPSPELLHSGSPTGDVEKPLCGFSTPSEEETGSAGPGGEISDEMVVDDAASKSHNDSEMDSSDGESTEQASNPVEGADADEDEEGITAADLIMNDLDESTDETAELHHTDFDSGDEMETDASVLSTDAPTHEESMLDVMSGFVCEWCKNDCREDERGEGDLCQACLDELNPPPPPQNRLAGPDYGLSTTPSHIAHRPTAPSCTNLHQSSRPSSSDPSPFSLPTSRSLRDIKPPPTSPTGQRKYPTIQEILNKSNKGTGPATGAADSDPLGPPQSASPPKPSTAAPKESKRTRSDFDGEEDQGGERPQQRKILVPKRTRAGDAGRSLARAKFAHPQDPLYPTSEYWQLEYLSPREAIDQVKNRMGIIFNPIGAIRSQWERLKKEADEESVAFERMEVVLQRQETIKELRLVFDRMRQIKNYVQNLAKTNDVLSNVLLRKVKDGYSKIEDDLDELVDMFEENGYPIFLKIKCEIVRLVDPV